MTADTSDSSPQKKKRIPLWFRLVMGVLLFAIIVVIGARLFIGSKYGRDIVERQLESLTVQGQSVELDDFEGDLLKSVSIGKISIRDGEGVWAEARNLSLGWSPVALVRRKVDISTLTADAVEVYRRPVLETSPVKEKTSSGELPLKAVTLDHFSISRLFLQEGVVPREVDASLKASLAWAPDKAKADIEILPVRDGGDKLVSTIHWNRKSPLRGEIDLYGPEGGLFASLLQVSPEQNVTMQFNAEGDEATVKAKMVAQLSGVDWLNFTVTPEESLHVFSGDIQLSAHPLTQDMVKRLGQTLNVSGNLKPEDPLQTLSLLAQTDVLTLDIRDIRQSDQGRSAFVRLRVSDPDKLISDSDVSLSQIALDGDVGNFKGVLSFEGQLNAEDLNASSVELDQLSGPLSVRKEGDVIEVVSDLRADKLLLERDGGPVRVDWITLVSDVEYNLEDKTLIIADSRLKTARSEVSAKGTTLVAGKFPSTANGRINLDLAEFDLYGTGKVQGSWSVKRGGNASSDVNLDLKATELSGGNEDIAAWIGKQVLLTASGHVTDTGDVSLPGLRLSTDAVEASGNLSYSGSKGIVLNADIVTAQDYPLASHLPGARLKIGANGSLDNLKLNGQLNAQAVNTDAVPIARPELGFEGQWVSQRLSGQARLTARVDSHSARVETGVLYSDGAWQLADLKGTWQALILAGDVSGNGGDLEALKGDVSLTGQLPDGMPANTVALLASRSEGRLKVSGEIDGIASGPLDNGKLILDISGTPENADYKLDLTGDATISGLLHRTDVSVYGNMVNILRSERQVTGEIAVNLGAETIQTRSPFSFRQEETGPVADLALSLFGGTADLSLSNNPNARLTLSVEQLGVSHFTRILGREPLEGDVSVQLRIGESGERLSGVLTGGVTGLTETKGDIPPIDLNLQGRLSDENLQISFQTPKTQELEALIELRIPVITQATPFSLSADERKSGRLEARLNGAVDNIMALVLPDDIMLTGNIDTLVSGDFPLDPATLSGRMQMSGGGFEHGGLGAVFQDIGFDLALENQQLDLKGFSALGRKGGTLKGSGIMGLQDGAVSNLNLTADKLVVIDRREGRAVASGTLGLEVDQAAFQITGDLTLDEGSLNLDRMPAGQEPTLDVRFEDDETETESTRKRPVTLDISVKAPRRLNVTGKGMDAELSLDSRITGSASDVSIVGRADIVRGRFELLGKRFTFQDSDITFAGDPLAAKLDILAVRQADDFLAKVSITGTPRRPEVSLDAEPGLPEDEVLSRVLFGRSPSQLTGLEAARLAAALAQMSGGGGFDLMGGIEQIAGLDTLDVSQNDSGQFQVATGRYLSEDVYLEVKSSSSGAPGVSVEWEPRDNISVGAETVPGEGQSLSIQWKKDFD